jgi:hypothetical protein
MFQKGAFHFGIKVFNHLLSSNKNLSQEEKQLRLALKRFLIKNSFYTLDNILIGNCQKKKKNLSSL